MLSKIIYLTRAAASFAVISIGLILLATIATAKKRTAFQVAIPAVITVGGALAWPRGTNSWRRDAATDRQIAYAKSLGVPLRKGMSKGEVSDLISQFKDAI